MTIGLCFIEEIHEYVRHTRPHAVITIVFDERD